MPPTVPPPRARAFIQRLGLAPHPESGWYRELHRSPLAVQPDDGRTARCALTSIDFVLCAGEYSAWHQVRSDEAWHLLEGQGLVLWLLPPTLDRIERVVLGPVAAGSAPRCVVPAGWWQAAEPLGEFAYVGATVGPGFEFADFAFGRDDPAFTDAVAAQNPDLARLL